VSDPTHHDPVTRWLAYAHPAWMALGMALAAAALRAGLALRRSRRKRARRAAGMRGRHLRLAKPAVVMLLIGFAGGPVSAVALRGWDAFATFHGVLGILVAALFVGAAWLGRGLEGGGSRAFDAHALLGGLAFLLGAVAAVAGFVLLP
jgi:hypothetical protein